MNIVPARSLRVAALLALTATACARVAPGGPLHLERRFDAAGLTPIDVRFEIQGEHGRAQQRYVAATLAALKQNGTWLGSLPLASLTVLDPPWHGSSNPGSRDVIVLERTPWLSTASSMTPELAAARGVSRRFWTTLVDTSALPAWFVDALAECAARRVVAELFEQENPPGFAFREERFFNRTVPRATRIHLRQATDGDPVPAYRSNPRVVPATVPGSIADTRSLEGKALLTLGTLEAWVGRPVFDQLVAAFVRGSSGRRPTLSDFARTATEVSGQDLSWLFDEAFGSSRVFDYGVERLTSEPDAAGIYVTTVVAARFGDARFTGSSAATVGGFESGRGIAVLVGFADGQRRMDYWDGRNRAKTFTYRSRARAVFAEVDPEKTLLLDLKPTNNSITLTPQAGVAARRWSARWMAWLEHALLNYGALV